MISSEPQQFASLEYRIDDEVAIITISHPPVNGLSVSVRRSLVAALRRHNAMRVFMRLSSMAAGADFPPAATFENSAQPPRGRHPPYRCMSIRSSREARSPLLPRFMGSR